MTMTRSLYQKNCSAQSAFATSWQFTQNEKASLSGFWLLLFVPISLAHGSNHCLPYSMASWAKAWHLAESLNLGS